MTSSSCRTVFGCSMAAKISPVVSRMHFSTGPPSFYPPASFPFPRHPYPTPYEIFHLPDTATTADIKSRYYELVKVHHPDIGFAHSHASQDHPRRIPSQNGELADSNNHFKVIIDAYELLKSPSRRKLYLRSGEGWPRSPSSVTRASRAPQRSSSAGRPYRPFYPSSLWDWASPDPGARSSRYSPPEEDYWFSAQHSGPRASTFSQQWQRNGLLAKNGVFISALGCAGMLYYCFQVWKILPLLNGRSKQDDILSARSPSQIHEPSGDERLDQDAWRRLPHVQTLATTPSAPLTQPSHDSSRPRSEAGLSYPHPFASKQYLDGIDKKSQMTAKALEQARAAAVPPSQLLRSKPIDSHS